MSARFTPEERDAIQAALEARDAIQRAIDAYVSAGFGSLVTDPLRDALEHVSHSVKQVQS
jgi:hypothetical protein